MRKRKPPTTREAARCTDHCSSCGSHFHSTEAFDSHREGDYETGRYCVEPEDVTRETKDGRVVPALEVAREDGRCDIGGGGARIGVRIWRRARVERPANASDTTLAEAA